MLVNTQDGSRRIGLRLVLCRTLFGLIPYKIIFLLTEHKKLLQVQHFIFLSESSDVSVVLIYRYVRGPDLGPCFLFYYDFSCTNPLNCVTLYLPHHFIT